MSEPIHQPVRQKTVPLVQVKLDDATDSHTSIFLSAGQDRGSVEMTVGDQVFLFRRKTFVAAAKLFDE